MPPGRARRVAMSEPSTWIGSAAREINADSPWLGLQAFTEATQRFFFGRDAELREMYLRVRDTPLTVFYGQSGIGKTSLLGAGLVPKLKAEGYKPVLLRLLFGADDPSLHDQIRAALATACASEEWPKDALLAMWGQMGLWEIFHRSDFWPKGSADLLGTNPPVLILDQFEELFTLGREQRSKNELRTLGMDQPGGKPAAGKPAGADARQSSCQ